MTTHVTLTDVMVDELRERLAKAERRVMALEEAIRWFDNYEPGARDAIMREADSEVFLAKARAT